ncbi:MAG: glycerophosphodiester phosphodiesterase [Thermoleophilia bacterium]|nr:glycerophosphodiester phosphodiesterase [Thermoleophilia bacterium]
MVLRIGHRGAAALAPENTLEAIERALEVGVDMVELDVVPLADGTLVLAHDAPAGWPVLPMLDEALALVRERGVDVLLDVKGPGYEAELTAAVRRHAWVERTLVSSCHAGSVRLLGQLEPGLRRGLTYPFDRLGISSRRLLRPATAAGLGALRAALPLRIGRLLARADASVATLNHAVIGPAVVRSCHARGAQVLAWTVDDPALAARLAALGVDGIISDDPTVVAGTF